MNLYSPIERDLARFVHSRTFNLSRQGEKNGG